MLALYVDYNARERLPDGGQAVAINLGRMNPDALEKKLERGSRVILYDEETRCEGVLRHGAWIEGWVAEIIPETVKDLPAGEFERLRTETKRAALGVAK
ncbi:hypothetical protein [Nitrospirillum sp. BR 11163]|uniref:hypothetical protein n=1 Tax=Nitrospirillum sp. BR 11163 TaxID=3104323 RepID=UPI002AFE49B8|nr:hypothetical protein [Nitrospirillum sp. BR 11163]MEA1677471.1 hypothetical protein [Nitrospirillum sp. BR 11163]